MSDALGTCPKCDGALAIKHGKKGAFIGCTHYPECDFAKPLHEHEESVIKVIDGSVCPECGAELAIKKGRYGMFIGCTNFPACHHIESNKQQKETRFDCPQCQLHHLVKRTNRYGKTFYACDGYPKCKFALNAEPLAGSCEACGFKLLYKKGQKRVCADKKCQHVQSEPAQTNDSN
ncbi:topoisomerase DNA-binding C4 zinc finger domain-containing protein [Neptunicella marina]|uniref:Topoisomerase DNA-binding C4 zinc finger domain-containing protein n=2 Tax=Neptunicella marina TaxID=2125989 RepID=A0A8J6LZZ2_9ALTE|nr:type I DNA topoisomerase [Neptunicella marina]MBC3766610.1 topoisomerase DNA-binding C4 zinc finger domain-containing protein [Neptunicella marina]